MSKFSLDSWSSVFYLVAYIGGSQVKLKSIYDNDPMVYVVSVSASISSGDAIIPNLVKVFLKANL